MKQMGLNSEDWREFLALTNKANGLQLICMCNMLLDMNDARIDEMKRDVQERLRVYDCDPRCVACLGTGVCTTGGVCAYCNGTGNELR